MRMTAAAVTTLPAGCRKQQLVTRRRCTSSLRLSSAQARPSFACPHRGTLCSWDGKLWEIRTQEPAVGRRLVPRLLPLRLAAAPVFQCPWHACASGGRRQPRIPGLFACACAALAAAAGRRVSG